MEKFHPMLFWAFFIAIFTFLHVLKTVKKGYIFIDDDSFYYGTQNFKARINFSEIKEITIRKRAVSNLKCNTLL